MRVNQKKHQTDRGAPVEGSTSSAAGGESTEDGTAAYAAATTSPLARLMGAPAQASATEIRLQADALRQEAFGPEVEWSEDAPVDVGERVDFSAQPLDLEAPHVRAWLEASGLTAEQVTDERLVETAGQGYIDFGHDLARRHGLGEVQAWSRVRELNPAFTTRLEHLNKVDVALKPTLENAAALYRFACAWDLPDFNFHGKSLLTTWREELDAHNLRVDQALRRAEAATGEPGERRLALQNIIENLDGAREQAAYEALELAAAAWGEQPHGSFVEQVENQLMDRLAVVLPPLASALKVQYPQLTDDITWLFAEGAMLGPFREWLDEQLPDLSFGESFVTADVEQVVPIPPEKLALIDQLVEQGTSGDHTDMQLLYQALACLDEGLLKRLVDAKYTITVARDNVANGTKNISGRRLKAGFVVDHADGLHSQEADGTRSITVRSFMRDGKLVLNVGTLMHELGHAVDLVLFAKGAEALHVNPAFAQAFADEHAGFQNAYFHQQPEFMAEFFALYVLDRPRAERKFPLATKAFDTLKLGQVVDIDPLVELHRSMVSEAPVTVSRDPIVILEDQFQLNLARAQRRKPPEPQIFELEGEPAAAAAVARQMGSHWLSLKAPTVSPMGVNDGFVTVDAALFNDPVRFEELLNDLMGTNGAVLYFEDLGGITPQSPGFERLRNFHRLVADLCPLVLSGMASERDMFLRTLGGVTSQSIELSPLSPEQIAELVRREATNDGYEFSEEALDALLQRTRGGDHSAAMELWRSIKQAQHDRSLPLGLEISRQPKAVGWVLQRDVEGAKVAAKDDPLAELNRMVGLTRVKEEITRLINGELINRQREKMGLAAKARRRLNLLFSGNPGTGKTTVARLLAALAMEHGLTSRSGVAIISATELAKSGPPKLFELFRKNRGGVIFVDEFHQLADPKVQGGEAILKALVPLLTDAEYADTIFIGAGYPEPLRNLMDVDPGLRRRFSDIPFDDYNRDELALIVDKKLTDRMLLADDDVRQAVLERVLKMQRSTKYPGNAGDVETVVEEAADRQQHRLTLLPDVAALGVTELQTLELTDVELPPRYSVDDVMNEIMALEGMDEAKSVLWGLVSVVEMNLENGNSPLTDVEPYFIIEGPAGSGKTTLARLIGKLFYAMDILPSDEVVESTGGKMVGGYLGNSSALAVQAFCERAWGRTGFIDEIVGMATQGDFSLQSAKELLTQTLNHRGKFVLVVADYSRNIDRFLGLDEGLARRFPIRIRLDPMAGAGAARLLKRKLEARGLDYRQVEAAIDQGMESLASLPRWASGGDVDTLDKKIWRRQVDARRDARSHDRAFDMRTLPMAVFQEALSELMVDVLSRPDPDGNYVAPQGRTAYQTAVDVQAEQAPEEVTELSDDDRAILDVISQVDAAFGAQFNDAELLARQEADPNSEYHQAIAKALGVTPEEAKQVREAIRVKVKRLVEVTEKTLVQRFKYHCPYCGGVDSPTCGYINYPLDWKIAHSKVKPWTEEVITTRKVERVVDEVVDPAHGGADGRPRPVDWI